MFCYLIDGDLMKKTMLLAVIFVVLGAVCGNYLYKKAPDTVSVFQTNQTFYFLQEGIYSSKDIMQENVGDLMNKLVVLEDNKYYVYVGITMDQDNANKIKKIYENMGYQIYIKKMTLDNEEFASNVSQFDLLVQESDTDEDVLTVEEVVLANYEQIFNV
jgi:hypothetical protein